jgi:hypothetical protein
MLIGETVRMTEGPFVGMEGTVVGTFGDRIVLAVVLRTREVQIEIDSDWTNAVTPRRRPASRTADPRTNRRRTR